MKAIASFLARLLSSRKAVYMYLVGTILCAFRLFNILDQEHFASTIVPISVAFLGAAGIVDAVEKYMGNQNDPASGVGPQ